MDSYLIVHHGPWESPEGELFSGRVETSIEAINISDALDYAQLKYGIHPRDIESIASRGTN